VSCAAALASLELILENKLYEKSEEKGKLFVELLRKHPAVQTIRQTGLMLAVELKAGLSVNKLVKILQANRLIVDQFLFNNSSFRIAPPLTISDEEIREISGKVTDSLNQLISEA
jgi:acetylornithine/succinyldiaminopimelate/putrescine aminotransferase